MEFVVEIIPKEKMVYIAEENSSGVKYSYTNAEDIGNIIKNYIEMYGNI